MPVAQPPLQNYKEIPQWGVKYKGWENYANITIYLGNGTRYGLLWDINMKSQVAVQSAFVAMTLSAVVKVVL